MMALPTLSHYPDGSGRWRGHPLFGLENIYRAYRKCRRRKRTTYNALAFELNLEENLIDLHESLSNGTYVPESSLVFQVDKPKQREIFAADFRDRVVHHILVNHLEPKWEPKFIHDSYACRKGKGIHKGVERLRRFTRKVTNNGARRAWYLQLDVRGYFIMLDRCILYELLAAHESDPAVLWLIETILFNDVTINCRFRKERRPDFDRLPPHKTLFKALPGCGLPIGNLTSQFFANVYLNELDQFVKHHLKCNYYLRYCDDFVMLSEDRDKLLKWKDEIERFLAGRLKLCLNEKRQSLQPVSNGINFLGYIVRRNYILVRKRVVNNLKFRLSGFERKLIKKDDPSYVKVVYDYPALEKLRSSLASYFGHFKWANSYRLQMSLIKKYSFLKRFFSLKGGRITENYRVPGNIPSLRLQYRYFERFEKLVRFPIL